MSDSELQERRRQLAEEAESRLAEGARRMAEQGIAVSIDCCLDTTKGEALLQKIADTKPDLVFKALDAPDFVLGLSTCPDWELIRNASAHIWFVKESVADIRKLITAIGTTGPDEDAISDSDSEVFAWAARIAELFDAEQVTAHAYHVPKGVGSYASYEPKMGVGNEPVIQPAQENERAQEAAVQRKAEAHGSNIREFAKSLDIDAETIHMVRGEPADVLPHLASQIDANLIVVGARNLKRLERVMQPVTAEPLLTESPSDILFVRTLD